MKHLDGGSKDQWPPVGKSSDTPKEVKNRKTGRNTTGIREASEYGAGCIYMHSAIPDFMQQTQLTDYKCKWCDLREQGLKLIPELRIDPVCHRCRKVWD